MKITRRVRNRTQRDGSIKQQTRYVLQWNCPKTGRRNQRFFERQKDALTAQSELSAAQAKGSSARRHSVTVGDCVSAWFEGKQSAVRSSTLTTYKFGCRNIAPLKDIRLTALDARDIRRWYNELSARVSAYTANEALAILRAAMKQAAEDLGIRCPDIPNGLQRQLNKAPKALLTPAQVSTLLEAAQTDDKALYVAFPFLTGVRASEQLGVLWSDIEDGALHIRRQQARDGSLVEVLKTDASYRKIPLPSNLRELLSRWQKRCPSQQRVFPAPNGGAFYYNCFRSRLWVPTLRRLGLPQVSHHSARHAFISMIQANGAEPALAAALAGHRNPTVTLSYYSHAVRGGEQVVESLERVLSAASVEPQWNHNARESQNELI